MTHPSFPLFPSDLLVGTALMTCHELGIYVRLLCYNWSHGGLPNDMARLCKLVGDEAIPAIVMMKFRVCDDGILRNQRMENERAKLTFAGMPQKEPVVPPVALLNGELSAYCNREGIHGKLREEGFPDAFRDWKAYRLEEKRPLSSFSCRSLIQKCERMGAKKAVRCIRRAIENSWINVKEDEDLFELGRSNKQMMPARPFVPSAPHDERASAKYEAERILAELPAMSEARKPIQIAILRQAVAKVGMENFTPENQAKINSIYEK